MRVKEQLIIKTIATCLIAVLVVGVAGRGQVHAMLAPAESAPAIDRDVDQATIRAALERKVIQQRLADLGYKASDIERRMNRLSDAQVHQVAQQIEKQHPAGDGGTVWIIVGAVLLLILLIAAIDDDDDDDDDDKDRNKTDVDVESSAPAAPANPPQTIIVK